MTLDYAIAGDYADEVRAFAMIESNEDEYAIGDGGQAFGLLQMHPATFKRYYIAVPIKFEPSVRDTWTVAFIKACATFLAIYGWLYAAQTERDLMIQAWNLGETAVFEDGERNPEYLARWQEAYAKVKTRPVTAIADIVEDV